MGIGGVSNHGGYIQNYKIPSVPVPRPEQTAEEPSGQAAEASLQNLENSENPVVIPSPDIHEDTSVQVPARKDARLEDLSLTLQKPENRDLSGRGSDIRSLDVEKALSDMRKDELLQQYQYFVGRSQNLMTENQDGAVFKKL